VSIPRTDSPPSRMAQHTFLSGIQQAARMAGRAEDAERARMAELRSAAGSGTTVEEGWFVPLGNGKSRLLIQAGH
jgi:hypothetical protein